MACLLTMLLREQQLTFALNFLEICVQNNLETDGSLFLALI